MSDGSSSSSSDSRVIPLRRRPGGTHVRRTAPPPVADLARYEASTETDDYRHRMIVNVAAFLFLAALIGGGIWVVDTMARMQKDQNCVLSGRRGCTPVELGAGAR
jgi:hypothetical protein